MYKIKPNPIDPDDSHVDKLKKMWERRPCFHCEHNFPMHLYIPPGQSFTHTCPGCGKQQTVTALLFAYTKLNEHFCSDCGYLLKEGEVCYCGPQWDIRS